MRAKIYTKKPCPFCIKAKTILKQKKIDFEEVDLTGNFDEMSKLKEKTNFTTFPQIFIDDNFIGGSSDLENFLENEK